MAALTSPNGNLHARERLLEAAAECFAARGFKDASVRDITAAAGCNIAAVNYHFGGKEALYLAVFRERLAELRVRRVSALEALLERDPLPLETVLATFAEAFLRPLTEDRRGQLTLRLVMRDMVDRHLPRDVILDEMIRPTRDALLQALDKACPALGRSRAMLCMHSLVAQLLHVLRMQELFSDTDDEMGGPSLREAIDHIVRFSRAGIGAYLEDGA